MQKIYHLAILSIFFFIIVLHDDSSTHSGTFKVSAYYHIEITSQVFAVEMLVYFVTHFDTSGCFYRRYFFTRASFQEKKHETFYRQSSL
ncbi:hypothetical protein H206_01783 [Candidatus Electrothrix aarhusensis]|uniref:Uncharacterized protein n=1 Tax=Candidatus Electrothrix aarhusensis TaxID=1859131 RepID=A0A444IVJ1_9BACT|nr:hypothetical protein H206_01783 [Candidatus Electrothrix aarhusensis]